MASPEHLNNQQSGEHIARLYHGTSHAWDVSKLGASYDSPFHVATDPTDFPAEKAFGGGYDAATDWDAMTGGVVREFEVHPEAKIHHTDTPHRDGLLDREEEDHVRAGGYDMTMFRGQGLGVVYNPKAIVHKRDLGYQDVTRRDPYDEMDMRHGRNWEDWV